MRDYFLYPTARSNNYGVQLTTSHIKINRTVARLHEAAVPKIAPSWGIPHPLHDRTYSRFCPKFGYFLTKTKNKDVALIHYICDYLIELDPKTVL